MVPYNTKMTFGPVCDHVVQSMILMVFVEASGCSAALKHNHAVCIGLLPQPIHTA